MTGTIAVPALDAATGKMFAQFADGPVEIDLTVESNRALVVETAKAADAIGQTANVVLASTVYLLATAGGLGTDEIVAQVGLAKARVSQLKAAGRVFQAVGLPQGVTPGNILTVAGIASGKLNDAKSKTAVAKTVKTAIAERQQKRGAQNAKDKVTPAADGKPNDSYTAEQRKALRSILDSAEYLTADRLAKYSKSDRDCIAAALTSMVDALLASKPENNRTAAA